MSLAQSGIFAVMFMMAFIAVCPVLSEVDGINTDIYPPGDEPADIPVILPTDFPTEEPTDYPIITIEPTIGGQYGWVSINSDPSGAMVTFDGTQQGFTPTQVQVMSTASPFHQIYLSMDGYQDWSTSLSENPGVGETIPIHAYMVPYGPTETPTPSPTPTIIGSDYGWVYIDSIPSGAEVTFDEMFQGSAPARIKVYTTGNPSHQILIRMTGYYDYISSLSRNPGPDETIPITANLVPKAQYGSIRVTSIPSQSVAIVDGGNQDLTPCTFFNLMSGTHTIKVIKDGYQSYSTQVSVTPGGTTQVSAQLNQVVSTGTLYVMSTPSGADILLDGIFLGQTPYTISTIAGTHDLMLKSAGYQTWRSAVTVYAGQQNQITESLVPQEPKYGAIQVASIPGGSAILLNNNYNGLTPSSGYLDIPDLIPGTYTISITHPQNQDYHGTVSVTAGQVSTVNVALLESPQPATLNGTLSVSSNPSGAVFFLDNLLKGVTPVILPVVQPGNHTITLKMENYHDVVRPITIAGGTTSDVVIDMIPVTPVTPEPTLSPIPTPSDIPVSKIPDVIIISGAIVICALIAILILFNVKKSRR